MSARKKAPRKRATPTPPPPRVVDLDLLLEARKKSFLLLLAVDGLQYGAGTYTHEEFGEAEALSMLVNDLAADLATLGKQGDGEPAVLERRGK